jgi:hypothetical protein
MTALTVSRTKLIPLGVLLILLGVGVPVILEQLAVTPTLPRALMIDLFRVGFFIGLALLVIGVLRNRRKRKTLGGS